VACEKASAGKLGLFFCFKLHSPTYIAAICFAFAVESLHAHH